MINNKKMKSFAEGGEIASLRSRTSSIKGKERHIAKNNSMSSDTKDFIQKICYRKTASIDMTQYGFITDSKENPVNYVINPLRAQLKKIRVKPIKNHPVIPSRTNVREVCSPTKMKPSGTSKSAKTQRWPSSTPSAAKSRTVDSPELLCGPSERNTSSSQAHHLDHPKSALSNPVTRSTRACVRKVRIQSEPSPSPSRVTKKVTGAKVALASPHRIKSKKNLTKKEKAATKIMKS